MREKTMRKSVNCSNWLSYFKHFDVVLFFELIVLLLLEANLFAFMVDWKINKDRRSLGFSLKRPQSRFNNQIIERENVKICLCTPLKIYHFKPLSKPSLAQRQKNPVGIADRKVFVHPESFCACLQNWPKTCKKKHL